MTYVNTDGSERRGNEGGGTATTKLLPPTPSM
jgi:hypothetical protein